MPEDELLALKRENAFLKTTVGTLRLGLQPCENCGERTMGPGIPRCWDCRKPGDEEQAQATPPMNEMEGNGQGDPSPSVAGSLLAPLAEDQSSRDGTLRRLEEVLNREPLDEHSLWGTVQRAVILEEALRHRLAPKSEHLDALLFQQRNRGAIERQQSLLAWLLLKEREYHADAEYTWAKAYEFVRKEIEAYYFPGAELLGETGKDDDERTAPPLLCDWPGCEETAIQFGSLLNAIGERVKFQRCFPHREGRR